MEKSAAMLQELCGRLGSHIGMDYEILTKTYTIW